MRAILLVAGAAAVVVAAVGVGPLVAPLARAGRLLTPRRRPADRARDAGPGRSRTTRGVPEGAEGLRILYTSTGLDGEPVAVSAVVMAPIEPRDRAGGPRPVLAYAHGTTGVVRGCAPSLSDDPLFEMAALRQAPARGWWSWSRRTTRASAPRAASVPRRCERGPGGPRFRERRGADPRRPASSPPRSRWWACPRAATPRCSPPRSRPAYAPDLGVVGVAPAEPATDLANPARARVGSGRQVPDVRGRLAWSGVFPELSFDEAIDRSRRARGALRRPSLPVGPVAVRDRAGHDAAARAAARHRRHGRPAWAAGPRASSRTRRPAGSPRRCSSPRARWTQSSCPT